MFRWRKPRGRGPWIQLRSGWRFYPYDPRAEDINIFDIAAALSKTCRFGGHCDPFYSVADHSVRVSRECSPADAMEGLLHDAPEAYLGDPLGPLKPSSAWKGYRRLEKRITRVIAERFHLRNPLPPSVHKADRRLLITEARDLMGDPLWASERSELPLPEKIQPLSSSQAYSQFLNRYGELLAVHLQARCPDFSLGK